MTVYISGKMTGCKNYKRNFRQAEFKATKKIRNKFAYQDIKIINPLLISKQVETDVMNPSYTDYMRKDLEYLINECDIVYFMRNWIFSKGARLEHHIAKVFGKLCIYE